MVRQLLCLWLIVVGSVGFERIKDYNKYLEQWEKIVPAEQIHDVTHLAVNNEICYGEKCKFYYYQYFSPGRVEKSRNRTVLLVSGMHGNQYIGPHTLLYGYLHFEAPHIVYFPIANPSGFALNQRLTHPNQIDTNRDFPVDNNKVCYQSNAAHILDFLLRKYKFDLTIILHDGMSQIGFNWGTHSQKQNSHTEDYEIQLAIGQLMQRVGGQNKDLGIQSFKVGTMSEVIYPASGSLDDWAYAVGKYPSVISSCNNFQYESYPKGMASDLVFLLELGPQQTKLLGSEQAINIGEGEESDKDGYVSRAIRMIRQGLRVVSPSLSIVWKQKQAQVTVRGCPSAVITSLDAFEIAHMDAMFDANYLFSLEEPLEIEGNARSMAPKPSVIKYEISPSNLKEHYFNFVGSFQCGKDWLGKGSSSFAEKRKYIFDVIETPSVLKVHKGQYVPKSKSFLRIWWQNTTFSDLLIIAVYVICVLVMMSAIFAILQCIYRPKKQQRPEKFQRPQSGDEIDAMGDDLHTARGGIIEEHM